MTTKINWRHCNETAQKAIQAFHINQFPIRILELLQSQPDVRLCPYSNLIRDGMTLDEIIAKVTKSEVGSTVVRNGVYFIFYNDDTLKHLPQQIRYTLAHELGHILLGHFDNENTTLSRNSLDNGLDKEEYACLEKEADAFASEFLSPIELVSPKWPVERVIRAFDISKESAEIVTRRLQQHTWLYKHTYFFNNPRRFSYTPNLSSFGTSPALPHGFYIGHICYGYCSACHSLTPMFTSYQFSYCPICGNSFQKKLPSNHYFQFHELEEQPLTIYKEYKLNASGKATQCPFCDANSSDGDFCDVCGTYLVNRCSGIYEVDLAQTFPEYRPDGIELQDEQEHPSCERGHALSGRSRFCPFCGAMSTFAVQSLFSDWRDEHNIQSLNDNVVPFPDDDIPRASSLEDPFA